jgi:hypothetical protein
MTKERRIMKNNMFAACSKTEEVIVEGRPNRDTELSDDTLQLVSAGLTGVSSASLASKSISIFNGASACKNNSQRTSGF